MSDEEGAAIEHDVDKLFDSSDDDDAEMAPSQPAEGEAEQPAPGDRITSPAAHDLEEAAMRAPDGEAPDRRYGSDDEEFREEGPPERVGSGSLERSPSPQVQQGPPLHLRAPLQDGPPSEQLRLVKASNILSVDTKPWSPEGHVYEEEVVEDPLTGAMRVQLNQRIRFRVVDGPHGRPVRESNARFVRWSDGSLQLLLGDEVLDVAETEVDHRYMFLRHPGFIQAQAHLAKRMAFRPSSITSAAHKRLKQAVRKQHGVKGRMTKATVTVLDPVKEKEAQAKLEEQKNRDRVGLVKRQAKMMSRYEARPGFSSQRARGGPAGGGLSARYLEGDDEDPDDDEDGAAGDEDLARPRFGLQEEEAERRLASAKRGAVPEAGPPAKRRRPGHEFDESDEDDGGGSAEENFGGGEGRPAGRRAMALSDEDDDE